MRSTNYKRYFLPLALFILAIITHLTFINNGFVWLDHIDIEEKNALITSPIQALSRPYSQTTFYRPLISSLHSLNYGIFGLWAPGYHLTNIIIHALVVMLSFLLIKKITRARDSFAFLASLIVMIHPASFYSVGLISFRTDPLAVMFMLGGVLCFIRYLENNLRSYLAYASLLFFLALLAKETVLLWYPGILVALYFRNPSLYKNKLRKIFVATAITGIIFLLLRSAVAHSLWGINSLQLPLSESLGTRIKALAILFAYLITPMIPPISDTIKIASLNDPLVIGALLLGGAYIFVLYRFRQNKEFLFFSIIILISIIPAANIIPLPRALSPHYLYFTVIATSAFIATLLEKTKSISRKIIIATLVGWTGFSGFLTVSNGARFSTDKSFFLPEVQKDLHFREGAYYVGAYFLKQRQFTLSEKYLRLAMHQDKDYLSYVDASTTANNLAIVLIQTGKLSEAEPYLEQSVREDSRSTRTRKIYNLALLKIQLNKPQEAVTLVEHEILSLKQAPLELYLVLAQAYIKENQSAKAALLLQQVAPLLHSKEEKDLWQKTSGMLP